MKNIQQALPSQESSISEQAAAWFLRMQEGDCGNAERQEFETWLASNAAHRSEYQQYVQLWRSLDQVGGVTMPSRRRKARTGIALVALVTILGIVQWVASREEIITTALGQRQHIVLADGTAGDTFIAWQWPLHSGYVFGWTGRILVCICGLLCPVIFVTGVIRWLQKRRARLVSKERRAQLESKASA